TVPTPVSSALRSISASSVTLRTRGARPARSIGPPLSRIFATHDARGGGKGHRRGSRSSLHAPLVHLAAPRRWTGRAGLRAGRRRGGAQPPRARAAAGGRRFYEPRVRRGPEPSRRPRSRGTDAAVSPLSAVPARDERLEDLPALQELERVVELRVGSELALLDVDRALARPAARTVVTLPRRPRLAIALRVLEMPRQVRLAQERAARLL